jgi:hypothetical protein
MLLKSNAALAICRVRGTRRDPSWSERIAAVRGRA